MPYIKQERRPVITTATLSLAEVLQNMGNGVPVNGDVVYALYLLVDELYTYGGFEELSDGIKVLEAAKLEFYRRRVAPYEDIKIKENGDV
jgi:hypothetical protein